MIYPIVKIFSRDSEFLMVANFQICERRNKLLLKMHFEQGEIFVWTWDVGRFSEMVPNFPRSKKESGCTREKMKI